MSGNPPSRTELQEGMAVLSVQGIEHQPPTLSKSFILTWLINGTQPKMVI
jgi:hypothetical protein